MKKTLAGIVLGLASVAAFAWPTKTVTIVVPFPPGGSTDMIARTISAKLGEKIGGTVVVDNKAGATGTIGAAQVARSEPDGYTLLVASLGPYVIAPHLMKVQYDALKDLDPITVAVRAPNVLVVPAASKFKTLSDVLAYLMANPGKMSFATSGAGSSDHLTSELFWQQTGTSGLHVPYKGGGPVMTDLLGNQVDSSFMNINTALPQIQAGKLRPLVITSAKRSPLLPDVPTLEESGIKDANVYSWQAVAGPHGMSAELKNRLQRDIAAILSEPATKAKLEGLGFELVLNTPEEFAKYEATEYARWQKLIHDRHITAN
ncbi:MAG: tripartite tricarboxylate transporter substrate binding protein [Burkholderiales bacterium]|nr:tripartite tricarboxylate transporter substrate binding protein [Burkholderiales bacterium]MBS0401665.1 tripartite tricarboxylate transporter substrate binding protein [Pseudomonadota bacterium]